MYFEDTSSLYFYYCWGVHDLIENEYYGDLKRNNILFFSTCLHILETVIIVGIDTLLLLLYYIYIYGKTRLVKQIARNLSGFILENKPTR